jgi:hypothetical protein
MVKIGIEIDDDHNLKLKTVVISETKGCPRKQGKILTKWLEKEIDHRYTSLEKRA